MAISFISHKLQHIFVSVNNNQLGHVAAMRKSLSLPAMNDGVSREVTDE